jgi:hypothetical protein
VVRRQAILPAQFDEYIWLDETCAVDPLPGLPESHAVEPPAGAEPLIGYARAYASAQADVLAAASTWAPRILTLPSQLALVEARRSALIKLGASLLRGLGNG